MNIALIMAKEGSIGLPGKNIWKIKDRTLLNWTILEARRSKLVDKVFVSTNGKKTAEAAKKAEAAAARAAAPAALPACGGDPISDRYMFRPTLRPTSSAEDFVQ